MRIGLLAGGTVVCLMSVSALALGQDAEHDWQKEYQVGASPTLTVETGDSSLDLHSCGACTSILIHVHTEGQLSHYILQESQTGNVVSFSLKEKPHVGIMSWHSPRTQVTVETPAKLQLEAKTADGSLAVRGVEGTLRARSSDGHMTLEDVRGDLHVTSSDGGMTIHHAAGTLEARGSDGHIEVDGQFSAVQLQTSDGNLEFSLAPGSQLNAASRIESSDGRVTVRVPKDLAAMLDVSTSDGRVDCALPLTMDHFDSREGSGHHVHGALNGGTVPLTIRTADGSVNLQAL